MGPTAGKRICFRQRQSRIFRNPDILVITNELGSGVIPADPFDRQWREASGRAACDLAKYAAEVHRVVCGIGTVIKE